MSGKSYKAAGVDIDACDSWLLALKKKVPAIGGFSGVFTLSTHIAGMKKPCLVASTDGVGTKVMVARAMDDYSTIGIDCVATVVNDLICCGARPIFLLDYLVVGRFDHEQADAILDGIRRGCDESGCELIGGETAEHPGHFGANDFDIAGFGVAVVDEDQVIDGSSIRVGNKVIGLASTGIHSNGLSLARAVLPEYEKDLATARELLKPTAIYVRAVLNAVAAVPINGIAHISGGGLPGNLCRVLPATVDARLDPKLWDVPEIFTRIQRRGSVAPGEMFRAFNMGIGMCLVVGSSHAEAAIRALAPHEPKVIGDIVSGSGRVIIEGVDT